MKLKSTYDSLDVPFQQNVLTQFSMSYSANLLQVEHMHWTVMFLLKHGLKR